MIETCIQRTDAAFQQWLKKGVTFISTDYIIPSEMCAMVNVILDAKNQSFELCTIDGVDVVTFSSFLSVRLFRFILFIILYYSRSLIYFQHQYHAKIDDLIEKTSAAMTQGMINKLVTVLETTLSKLSRYDEGSFIGSILSLTVFFFFCFMLIFTNHPDDRAAYKIFFQKVSGSGKEMGQAYVSFTRNCMDQIRGKVLDELWILTFFEVIKIITTLCYSTFFLCSQKRPLSFSPLLPPLPSFFFLLSSFFLILFTFFLFTLAMVHGANSNAVHVALGKTRPQLTSISMYLFGPYRKKNLLGL